ncbi:energy transducer TonB [bacterium]|nr:energy transducer TonB [bacterium]
MRISSLGVCLTLSALLNLVGFAPLMTFLLGRGGAATQAPRPPVQVRLLNKQLEPSKQPVAQLPPEPEKAKPPEEKPRPSQQNVSKAQASKPDPNQIPEDEVPKARPEPRKHSSKPTKETVPSGPLTRPDEKAQTALPPPGSGNSAPFTTPANASTPAPAGPEPLGETGGETPTPGPAPSDSPPPLTADTNSQPTPPPSSGGDKPDQGTIPEKPAVPRSNPPNTFSRPVLRKLGGKHLIRLTVKIHPDGHIEPQVLVSSGSAELDAAVLNDLKTWKWDPAEAAGKPVLTERQIRLKLEAD